MNKLLLAVLYFAFLSCAEDDKVKVIESRIVSAQDIHPIEDSLVIPYVYTKAISLNELPVAEKKKKFFEMLLPAILVAKTEQSFTLEKLSGLSKKTELTDDEQAYVNELMETYKSSTIHMLMARLREFPTSIVLAQAAIESGWGTSRFFLQANNPFGMWSFDPNESRIKASSHRAGEQVYLRKFPNLEKAIEAYYVMLATGPYSDFRAAIRKTDNPYELCDYLIDYSERREAYVEELKNVIKSNDLTNYDDYRISPKYIVE